MACASLTTILQLVMNFGLGWISQQINIYAALAVLALIYALGTASAFQARRLLNTPSAAPS